MKRIVVVSVVLGLCAMPAAAVSPAAKCESAKLKEAGKYSFCRLKAESSAAKTGLPADYAKCNDRLVLKWPLIETKAGGSCPSNGDLGALQTFLVDQSDTIADALAGGGLADCPADLGTCTASLAACEAAPTGRPLQSGQATCHDSDGNILACAGTGQDGDFEAGLAQAYVNHGDGTISDTRTGLMWEVLSDDGSIHDWDNTYSWSDAFDRVADLNTAAFAGHSDWRLPNRVELSTILSLGAAEPSVFPAFNSNCAPTCAATACSCTRSESYWSSSTFVPFASSAWLVDFRFADIAIDSKPLSYPVRAVRDL